MKKIISIESVSEEIKTLLEVEEKDIELIDDVIERYNNLYDELSIDYDILTFLKEECINYKVVKPFKTYSI